MVISSKNSGKQEREIGSIGRRKVNRGYNLENGQGWFPWKKMILE